MLSITPAILFDINFSVFPFIINNKKHSLLREEAIQVCKHIWFGGGEISFPLTWKLGKNKRWACREKKVFEIRARF